MGCVLCCRRSIQENEEPQWERRWRITPFDSKSSKLEKDTLITISIYKAYTGCSTQRHELTSVCCFSIPRLCAAGTAILHHLVS
jgi:hypothetical protein